MATSRGINRLSQVGNICTQWAWIEYQFALVIWSVLSLDEATGKIVSGGLDMLPRANMAINLANHLNAPRKLTSDLTAARAAIQKDLSGRRNRAVHGVTFTSPNHPGSHLVEVHRGEGGRERNPLTDDDLKALGAELHTLGNSLHETLKAQSIVNEEGVFITPTTAIARKTRSTTAESASQPGSKSP